MLQTGMHNNCLTEVHTEHLSRSVFFFSQCLVIQVQQMYTNILSITFKTISILATSLVFCKVNIQLFLLNTSNIKQQKKDSDPKTQQLDKSKENMHKQFKDKRLRQIQFKPYIKPCNVRKQGKEKEAFVLIQHHAAFKISFHS